MTADQLTALQVACALLYPESPPRLLEFIERRIADDEAEPTYTFVGPEGRATVTAKQLNEYRYCSAAIRTTTGVVIDPLTPREWVKVVRALMLARDQVTLHAEASECSATRERLRAWLTVGTIPSEADRESVEHVRDCWQSGRPVRRSDGLVYVSIEAMLDKAQRDKAHVDRREFVATLQAMGVQERYVVHYLTDEGVRTTRAVYAVPRALERELLGGAENP